MINPKKYPKAGTWCWVRVGDKWTIAMRTARAVGGWMFAGDGGRDWTRDVEQFKVIPSPVPKKRSGKGSGNEREKCREWSLWWTRDLPGGPRDDVFWRTSGSGARARVRANLGKRTHGSYGDMAAVDPIGEPLIKACTFEFKKGYTKDIDVLTLLDGKGKNSTLKQFFDQVIADADAAGNEPVIVIHRDFMRPVIGMRPSLFGRLDLVYGIRKRDRLTVTVGAERDWFVMIRLEDFFRDVSPKFFMERIS